MWGPQSSPPGNGSRPSPPVRALRTPQALAGAAPRRGTVLARWSDTAGAWLPARALIRTRARAAQGGSTRLAPSPWGHGFSGPRQPGRTHLTHSCDPPPWPQAGKQGGKRQNIRAQQVTQRCQPVCGSCQPSRWAHCPGRLGTEVRAAGGRPWVGVPGSKRLSHSTPLTAASWLARIMVTTAQSKSREGNHASSGHQYRCGQEWP